MSLESIPVFSEVGPRHHHALIALHWLMVILLVAAVALVLTREAVEDRAIRQLLMDMHRTLGLLILAITSVRLVVRFFVHGVNHHLPKLLALLSTAGQMTTYVLLFIIPLLGWGLSSAAGRLTLFGAIPLPALIGQNRDVADVLSEAHETAALLLLLTVLGHVGAALWHHFFRKDTVLRSMLPCAACTRCRH